MKKVIRKTCSRGHKFYKSSDCPVCPICWPGGQVKTKAAGGHIVAGLPVPNRTQTGVARLRAARGQVHKMPVDLKKALASTPAALSVWEDITPLARNEWTCWVTSGKKAETRNIRIEKALSKLSGGMRRPCCWAGCIHRWKKETQL